MWINQPNDFAVVIRAIEAELGLQYPIAAPDMLTELSSIVGSTQHHAVFEHARLLVTSTDVIAQRGELGESLIEGGYFLPFLIDENGEWPDIYGFDATGRVAVFCVHTIVAEWASPADFLHWVRTFTPPPRTGRATPGGG